MDAKLFVFFFGPFFWGDRLETTAPTVYSQVLVVVVVDNAVPCRQYYITVSTLRYS